MENPDAYCQHSSLKREAQGLSDKTGKVLNSKKGKSKGATPDRLQAQAGRAARAQQGTAPCTRSSAHGSDVAEASPQHQAPALPGAPRCRRPDRSPRRAAGSSVSGSHSPRADGCCGVQ